MMRRIAKWTAILLILSATAMQAVRPPRTNPSTDPARGLFARVEVPADAARVLDRACRDCHSNETQWPWYSHVAPVSWFVIDHVNHGRRHFNYSDWAKYDAKEATGLLKQACKLARNDVMPLGSYTVMHRDARLSDADISALCDWADATARTARRTP